jgi:2-haloacid dehalogenase
MKTAVYTRREFAVLAMMGVGGTIFRSNLQPKFKYIAFDSFAIFDPSSVAALIKQKYPEKGGALFEEWRNKQFQYTWLLTSAGRFKDFRSVLEHSLIYAAKAQGITLAKADADEFLNGYYNLKLWPDTIPCLKKLKENGVKTMLLSNFTLEMLKHNAQINNIDGMFDSFISADAVKKFKPAPEIYELGAKAFKTPISSILYVPFAPWDAAGAKWHSYPVYWVNRAKSPREEIAASPDGTGSNLYDLCSWLQLSN